MKTELIYLTDAYKKELEVQILEIEEINPTLVKVILDKTILFPEGGGQPSDQGFLISNDISFKVAQIRLESGEIKHYVEIKGEKPQKGKCIIKVDWQRRFRNMQVHTAGHIVDWAVSELKLHNTELIPLEAKHGKNAYICYKGKSSSIEKTDLQKRVNKILENNLKITTELVSFEELKERALYLFPNLPQDKPLRIVTLQGYKSVPDGGTLTKKSGEVKKINLKDIEVKDGNTYLHYEVEEEKSDKASKIDASISSEDLLKQLEDLETQSEKEINAAENQEDLDSIKVKYIGRKSDLINILRNVKNLPQESRAHVGQVSNEIKNKITLNIETKEKQILSKSIVEKNETQWIDVTAPGAKPAVGHVHPITQMLWRATDIFQSMGFEIIEPTEIDNDFNHFTALNIPESHPARDMWDTFWTEDENIAIAHTSTMQNRILSTLKPPIRAIVPGRCFRNEATDSSHEHTFYQIEGIYLDKNISIVDLISTLKTFLIEFTGKKDLNIKIQPTYFPFVEPAIEIMMERPGHTKKDADKYDNREWLEVLPCGPIHPNVLKAAGIDPNEYSGFAWGLGLDRLVMVKYGIEDIRHFHGGDLRFLQQF